MRKVSEPISRAGKYFSPTDLTEGLRKKTISSAAATIACHASAQGTQVIGSVILARLLTPDDFGLVIMVATFSILLMNFGLNGFTEAVIQQEKLEHLQVSNLFWINLGSSTLLTLLFMTMGPWIAAFYGQPELIMITVAMSFSILFGGLSTQHMALLKRNMQFRLASMIELGAFVFSYVVGIVMALGGFGYWSLVVRQVSFTAGYSLGAWIFCSWRPGLPAGSKGIGGMVRFGMSTYGTFAVSYLQKNLDRILIGKIQGIQPLGNYDRAYGLFALPAGQITAPLANVSLAALSRLRQDPARFREVYLKAVFLLAIVGMPLSAIMTVVGQDLILLLLGPKWGEAGMIFTIFAPSAGIALIYATTGWLHLSLGKADRWLRWSVFDFLVTASFFVAGLPFGVAWVALGRVVSIHLLAVPGLWYAGRPVGLKISQVLGTVWRYYVSAFVAGGSSWAFLQVLSVRGVAWEVHGVRVLLGTVVCISVYLFVTVVLHQGAKPIMDFLEVLRESLYGLRSEGRA